MAQNKVEKKTFVTKSGWDGIKMINENNGPAKFILWIIEHKKEKRLTE